MSRRTQVVRTDDQGGVGNPRFLGGTEVLCSTADCGQINATDPTVITSIPVGASSDYRRCLVAATVGNIAAYKPTASPSYPRTVAFSRLDSPPADWDFPNLFPSESPHYSITESDGDNRLDRVSWYGRHRADTATYTGEGGIIEFWIDDTVIHTFHSAPVSGEANNEFPIDLTGLNMVLVPGQEIYFKDVVGEWTGWSGLVHLVAFSEHPLVGVYWPP